MHGTRDGTNCSCHLRRTLEKSACLYVSMLWNIDTSNRLHDKSRYGVDGAFTSRVFLSVDLGVIMVAEVVPDWNDREW